MTPTDFFVGLAIAVGIVGIVVPVLPGSLLVLAAILVWALETGSASGWTVFAVATTLLAAGAVVKYAVPGRRLKTAGVPNRTLWFGAALGVVGFFVIPVVGLFVGFLAGVYLAEHQRLGASLAWPSTKHALRAVGLSLLIEMAAALLAALVWFVGALAV
ncbi:DUF456 domain-containing protein [Nocardioides mesophilus]|uniref:DUF456 domain-containing protein n=1 Tax=Nocardioides mesophilus TaxID=433659 RepID=A0A7G9RBN4_9ACTN|nr:DUF456 domain-containing protein [Nocardioides mesophilus]QNN53009.1 DUF456 domain-containing protein [Nocardioides mesophilus]